MRDWGALAGYADRLSARPGESLRLMVSATDEVTAEVVDLVSGEPSPIGVTLLDQPGEQAVRGGARIEAAADPALRPANAFAVRVWLWLAAGFDRSRRHVLISSWDASGEDGYALSIEPGGRPAFEVGSGARSDIAVVASPLPTGSWSLVEGRCDPAARSLSVAVDSEGGERTGTGGCGSRPGRLVIGAERRGDPLPARDHLDGKLEDPQLEAAEGTISLLDLGGVAVNGPVRRVTGRRWSGDVHDWRAVPDQYAAIHFHSDATDDLGWPAAVELEVPPDCPGGLHAARLRSGDAEDLVPFVVRGGPEAGREYAVLLPSFTYLAYSCELAAPLASASSRPEDAWAARHGMRSLYDRHADGVGVYEASLLRPLSQLRPDYPSPRHGGPHGLGQDLILLRFLAGRRLGFDLLTDHDLDREGLGALGGARTLITGAHPEYASARMLDAIDAHLERGGSLAYLGGNGLNGCVAVDPQRPHVVELRRTETRGLVWQALPGEHHLATSGEHGGDWRRRGRPEHAVLGVGLCAFGDDGAAPYRRVAPAGDPAAEIVFAGLPPEEPIGCDGAVLGGAAGFEVDCFDPALGSPEDCRVLARSDELAGYETWGDDTVADTSAPGGDPTPRHAEMTLRRTAAGGAVFSVGSVAWTGALAEDPAVATVTANVLTELARERPFEDAGR